MPTLQGQQPRHGVCDRLWLTVVDEDALSYKRRPIIASSRPTEPSNHIKTQGYTIHVSFLLGLRYDLEVTGSQPL